MPQGEELIFQRAASNSIIKRLYHHHHHVTPGAYENILELTSFTDRQDTHSPSFLLQGRDAAPTAPLPLSAPTLLDTDGCVRTFSYTMTL